MNQSSPVRPSPATGAKRTHETMTSGNPQDNDDDDDTLATAPSSLLVNQNTIVGVKQYAEKKRLRVEQIGDVGVFMQEPAVLREAKLLVNILAVGNELEKIVASKPAYEVSEELETNLRKYAPAILLSSKLTSYKGNAPKEILLTLAKQFHFIPAGLEKIPTDWAKVDYVAGDAFTQTRSKFKKLLGVSVKAKVDKDNKKSFGPTSEHQNIYELAQAMVKGTQCSVNVELCARIALMRSVYIKHSGPKFWDKIDERLVKIRNEADGDSKKIVRAFRHLLTADQNARGTNNYVLEDRAADEFQQRVDDIIDVRALDVATSAQGDGDGAA
ncbi:hypothetical protein C8R46DRAFT_1061209, partial [Mycena filopes]